MNLKNNYNYGPQNYKKIETTISNIQETIGDPSNPANGTIYSDIDNITNIIGNPENPDEGTIYSDIEEINNTIGSKTQMGTILGDINTLNSRTTIQYVDGLGNIKPVINNGVIYFTKFQYTIPASTNSQIVNFSITDQYITNHHYDKGYLLSFNALPLSDVPYDITKYFIIQYGDPNFLNHQIQANVKNSTESDVTFNVWVCAIFFAQV